MADKTQNSDSSSDPGSPEDQWTKAVDSYREIARWLIVIFGTVGGLIAGTAPLSGIGQVQSNRVGFLIGGGAAALGGVSIVLAAVVSILVPQAVYLHELAPAEQGRWKQAFTGLGRFEDILARHHQDLLPRDVDSVPDLLRIIADLEDNYEAEEANVMAQTPSSPAQKAAQTSAANAASNLSDQQKALSDLLMVARFEKARTRFSQAILFVLGGGVVTATGLGCLLYGIAGKAT